MDFTGMSDALAGIGKAIEKNPEVFSSVLGTFGQAVSPQNSWQSRLGGATAGMAQGELQRQFLQQLLGGEGLGEEEELAAAAGLGGGGSAGGLMGLGANMAPLLG